MKTKYSTLEKKQEVIICQIKGASGIGLSIKFRTTLLCSRKRKPKNDLQWKKTSQQVYEEATKKFEQDPSVSNLNTLNEAKEILESY